MAFPTVETTSVSAETSGTTSHTVAMPSGVTSGDLLICIFKPASGTSTWSVTMTGWTALYELDEGFAGYVGVFYRTADGTEGANETITTGNSVKSAHAVFRISGHDTGENPEAAGDGSPPGPDLTPSWGSADNLWISYMAGRRDDWDYTVPSGYSNELEAPTDGGTSTTSSRIETARLEQTDTDQTGAEYDWTGTGANNEQVGLIAIKGADPIAMDASADTVQLPMIN